MSYETNLVDESILVCVYYGASGEQLIRRGHKLATLLNCPLYVLTVDTMPIDTFNAEKSRYIECWQQLAVDLQIKQFIIKDNEKRPIQKVIKNVVREHHITQIIVGQSAQSRWEEITKGAFINVLLREIPTVDVHIVSIMHPSEDDSFDVYEKGVRAYLTSQDDDIKVAYICQRLKYIEGIFFKEIGTDFDNGIFKFTHNNTIYELTITEGVVVNPSKIPSDVL